MAQRVGYFENHVDYTEGPFVMVDINGWRIEAQNDHAPNGAPTLPHPSIYHYLEQNGLQAHKVRPTKEGEEQIAHSVNWLNDEVDAGNIVKIDGRWVAINTQHSF